MVVSTGFAVIRPRKIEPDYLSFLLRSDYFIENVVSRSVGVSYPATNATEVVKIPIVQPCSDEQLNIAIFLSQETKKIDGLVSKKRALIEKLKEKRTALISRTVTRGLPPEVARTAGLDPHPKLKPSGVEWLGDVPEHWGVKRLSYMALLKSGENITSEQIEETGEFPVYGGNGLRGYYSDFTHNGDYVLIGRQGALCGNINYASGRFWASEHAVVVNPLTPFVTNWLGEVLRAMNLNQYSVSAAQPGLSVSVISALKVPVPPFKEQNTIAAFLERETFKIDQLASKIEAAIDRLQEYRTALITAAVTGKIDVRAEAGGGARTHTGSHGRTRTGTDKCGDHSSATVSGGPCSSLSSSALAANAALSLLNLACHLLDRQIAAQAKSFEKEGGFTERLYRVRTAKRRGNR